MNWGWRIFLLYTVFVLMTLGAVFFTLHQDVFLVSDDYYKEEIAYQDKIDEMVNYSLLKDSLQINYRNDRQFIEIKYPPELTTESLQGKITFFRPSDARLDRQIDIVVGDGIQNINAQDMLGGLWKVKLDWTANGKSYYTEKDLMLK